MKKITLIIAVLVLSISAMAQNVKIGYLNSNEVIMLMPELNNVETEMANFNEQNSTYLQRMQKEIQDKMTQYEAEKETLPENIRKYQEEELQTMYERFQNTYQTLQQETQKKQEELMQPVIERFKKAVETVGKRLSLTMVHDASTGQLLYIGDSAIDITKEVKKELGILN